MAGYSATPLARKLGLQPGQRVALVGAPPEYPVAIEGVPEGVTFETHLAGYVPAPVTLVFEPSAAALAATIPAAAEAMPAGGMLWVAWPKKTARRVVPSDVTEDVVRALALAAGLVDVKVCAISEVWSGLKLVRRRAR